MAPKPPRFEAHPADLQQVPRVSIVVPARNEAARLPDLLRSLEKLDYPDYEVIVVDDCSTDGTAAVVESFGARLVSGNERPPGWAGKQWACFQGASIAVGDVLLFTDADTVHTPNSLTDAVSFLKRSGAAMISSLPYHDANTWWERLLGPFHVLLLAVTAPFGTPRPGRVYAIGQYLMLTRAAYAALGGHASVKGEFVEDLPLANLCLERGLRYRVYHGARLFSVRMYDSLGEFVRGWRRNFRAGIRGSSALAPVEMTLMIAALTGGGKMLATPWSAALVASSVFVLLGRQRDLGRFSWCGPVLFPFALALLCWVSLLAAGDMLFRRKLYWKGRAYAA
jgi:glycosyltransferase involved in cell wall biosynthesis